VEETTLRDPVAIDFFLVSTPTFRLLFVFVVLRHDRREIPRSQRHRPPHRGLDLRQLIQPFPEDMAPSYLLRDRDGIYGQEFSRGVERMGIREVRITPRALGKAPFVEWLIRSIRRECLNHALILNEAHLRRVGSMAWT
jgi:hypothetical protein